MNHWTDGAFKVAREIARDANGLTDAVAAQGDANGLTDAVPAQGEDKH